MTPVLAIRDFRLLVITRFLAAMALQAQAVIIGWQVYQLTHDPLLLGLIGLTEAIPAIGCAFVSGHLVDRHRPGRLYQLSLAVLFANTCVIWLSVAPFLALGEKFQLWILFTGIFVSGAARSFSSPSVYSITPRIVPRNLISAASAWISSAFQFASISGPAIGGLIYAYGGPWIAFTFPPLIMAGSFFASGLLSPATLDLRNTSKREPFVASIRAGIAFALGNKVLLSTMTLDMFSVLFGGAVAILPMFADEVLKSGSTGLGLLRAAPAVGSGIVALVLAFRPMKVISGAMLLWVIAGFGVCTLAFAVSTHFVLALVFLALSGAFDGISMVIRSTILQLLTPDDMRGRVSALNSVFITSSNEIGAFESGVAARLLGLVPSILFGGTMTLLVVGFTAWRVPALGRTRIGSENETK